MDASDYFVYIKIMQFPNLLHEGWREAPPVVTPQIITSAFCVLLKWEFRDLSAPYWRWYWNDRPGASITLQGRRHELEPGRVFLMPPHTSFATRCDGSVGHLFMHFALALDRSAPPGEIFVHETRPVEKRIIADFISALGDPQHPAGLEVSFLSQALVHLALARIPRDFWSGSVPDPKIEKTLRSLRDDVGDNADLARAAGMNTNAFVKKFRHATGHTPHQYRLRLRVERACGLLLSSRKSIADIAEETGFCDRYHFTRVFRRIMNVGPAAFRRR